MSKSVATIVNVLFFNSNKTLDNIGSVFFFQQHPERNLKTLTICLF